MTEESVKETIIKVTLEMLKEGIEPDRVTTREIARRAGVAVGMINYHFQTKDNLINVVIQRYIDKVVHMTPGIVENLSGSPREKLAQMIKLTAGYLAHNQEIARISILHDMISGNARDNTQSTFNVYYPLVRDVVGTDERMIWFVSSQIIYTCQSIFLRAHVLKEMNGFDFFNDQERDTFIQNLVDRVCDGIEVKEE